MVWGASRRTESKWDVLGVIGNWLAKMSAPCSKVWCFALPERPSTKHDRFEGHDSITWSRRRQFRQHFLSFSQLKIFEHDSCLPQAKQDEVSNVGLLFLAGVELAKMLGGVLGDGIFTGLDDTLTGFFLARAKMDLWLKGQFLRCLQCDLRTLWSRWCRQLWEDDVERGHMLPHCSCLWRGRQDGRGWDLSSATCPMAINALMTLEPSGKPWGELSEFLVGTNGMFMSSWMWARATRCGRL